ncbi:MAG TPA: T9SS type A sorting domain-containing protein [Flavipsychrobacter sp.]|nr:T9SS type A sorting domain-containing protein [Flavipsychrobacter sp.]
MKQLLLTCICIANFSLAQAQNWQYVGSPNIHQNSSTSTYLYFADMEMNAAGNIFIGYWVNSGALHFAQYNSGTWSPLPSPGNFAVNNVDIEVHGSNYYIAYSGVRGSNMYAWVRKYDGTAWQQLGDSMLLGNSGSGGWFEFLLDNNEVPTLLGAVSAPFADKQMMQYTGGNWTNVLTLTSTNATLFRENSALFDTQNKLLCITSGLNMSTAKSYAIVNKIDGTTRTVVGDSIFVSATNGRIKLDAAGTPHICLNNGLTSKVLAFKLNGTLWNFIADTTSTTGTMLNADVSGTGKVVFTTLQANVDNSVYFYENNGLQNMDSVNINGFAVGAISDLVIPAGSNEAYVLVQEIKSSAAQDYSVLKHVITGSVGIKDEQLSETFKLHPNPSSGLFTITRKSHTIKAAIKIYDLTGSLVFEEEMNETKAVDLRNKAKGIYFLKLTEGNSTSTTKLLLQ